MSPCSPPPPEGRTRTHLREESPADTRTSAVRTLGEVTREELGSVGAAGGEGEVVGQASRPPHTSFAPVQRALPAAVLMGQPPFSGERKEWWKGEWEGGERKSGDQLLRPIQVRSERGALFLSLFRGNAASYSSGLSDSHSQRRILFASEKLCLPAPDPPPPPSPERLSATRARPRARP